MSTRPNMRILADENMSRSTILALRAAGYDVVAVKEQHPGLADEDILHMAQSDHRLIISHDKDFGELAVRCGLPASSGIILFRVSRGTPHDDAARIVAILGSREDWPRHFSVVDDEKIRMRPIPAKGR